MKSFTYAILLLQCVLSKGSVLKVEYIKKVENCPTAGYYFQKDLQPDGTSIKCQLCLCKDSQSALCWKSANKNCEYDLSNREHLRTPRQKRNEYYYSVQSDLDDNINNDEGHPGWNRKKCIKMKSKRSAAISYNNYTNPKKDSKMSLNEKLQEPKYSQRILVRHSNFDQKNKSLTKEATYAMKQFDTSIKTNKDISIKTNKNKKDKVDKITENSVFNSTYTYSHPLNVMGNVGTGKYTDAHTINIMNNKRKSLSMNPLKELLIDTSNLYSRREKRDIGPTDVISKESGSEEFTNMPISNVPVTTVTSDEITDQGNIIKPTEYFKYDIDFNKNNFPTSVDTVVTLNDGSYVDQITTVNYDLVTVLATTEPEPSHVQDSIMNIDDHATTKLSVNDFSSDEKSFSKDNTVTRNFNASLVISSTTDESKVKNSELIGEKSKTESNETFLKENLFDNSAYVTKENEPKNDKIETENSLFNEKTTSEPNVFATSSESITKTSKPFDQIVTENQIKSVLAKEPITSSIKYKDKTTTEVNVMKTTTNTLLEQNKTNVSQTTSNKIEITTLKPAKVILEKTQLNVKSTTVSSLSKPKINDSKTQLFEVSKLNAFKQNVSKLEQKSEAKQNNKTQIATKIQAINISNIPKNTSVSEKLSKNKNISNVSSIPNTDNKMLIIVNNSSETSITESDKVESSEIGNISKPENNITTNETSKCKDHCGEVVHAYQVQSPFDYPSQSNAFFEYVIVVNRNHSDADSRMVNARELKIFIDHKSKKNTIVRIVKKSNHSLGIDDVKEFHVKSLHLNKNKNKTEMNNTKMIRIVFGKHIDSKRNQTTQLRIEPPERKCSSSGIKYKRTYVRNKFIESRRKTRKYKQRYFNIGKRIKKVCQSKESCSNMSSCYVDANKRKILSVKVNELIKLLDKVNNNKSTNNSVKIVLKDDELEQFAVLLADIIDIVTCESEQRKITKKRERLETESKTVDVMEKIKHLINKYDLYHNTFINNMFKALKAIQANDSKKENKIPVNDTEMLNIKIFENLKSLGKLMEQFNSTNNRIKRRAVQGDDSLEAILIMLEHILRRKIEGSYTHIETDEINKLMENLQRTDNTKIKEFFVVEPEKTIKIIKPIAEEEANIEMEIENERISTTDSNDVTELEITEKPPNIKPNLEELEIRENMKKYLRLANLKKILLKNKRLQDNKKPAEPNISSANNFIPKTEEIDEFINNLRETNNENLKDYIKPKKTIDIIDPLAEEEANIEIEIEYERISTTDSNDVTELEITEKPPNIKPNLEELEIRENMKKYLRLANLKKILLKNKRLQDNKKPAEPNISSANNFIPSKDTSQEAIES